jgi:hypothetical protein
MADDDAKDRAIAVADLIRSRIEANEQRAKLTSAQRKLLELGHAAVADDQMPLGAVDAPLWPVK